MNKTQLKTAFAHVKERVDHSTGEVFEETIKKHNYIANSKEKFFLGYVSMLSLFQDISGPSIKVYSYLLLNYNTGTLIGITSGVKANIRNFIKSGAKNNTVVDNALSELVKSGFLLRGEGRGDYYLNPRYAFYGSTSDRNQSLKVMIELGYEGTPEPKVEKKVSAMVPNQQFNTAV